MTDDSKKHDCGVYARVRARKIHIASRHHLRTYANGSVPPSNFISINSRQALLRSAFTTKKHDGTRSHAAKALPRRSTKEHEEARRNTKEHETMRRRLQRRCLGSRGFSAADSTMSDYIFREGPRSHAAPPPQGFVFLRSPWW